MQHHHLFYWLKILRANHYWLEPTPGNLFLHNETPRERKHNLIIVNHPRLTTLSSFWLSEANKLHSMSRGARSSGPRVNWHSSFTVCPLALSMDDGPVMASSRPEARPGRTETGRTKLWNLYRTTCITTDSRIIRFTFRHNIERCFGGHCILRISDLALQRQTKIHNASQSHTVCLQRQTEIYNASQSHKDSQCSDLCDHSSQFYL